MPLRIKNGKLEWRFKVAGHTYSKVTDLADTPKNRVAAMRMEAEARKLVLEGRATDLTIRPEPFISAAEAFCAWADGEYIEHPNSAKRLRTSMTSAKVFFAKWSVSAITTGLLEDYKSWRRVEHKVEEVTIRHDLHALSVFFQYAKKKGWCRGNLIEEIEIPSDRDATRTFVLTEAEEKRFFDAIDHLIAKYTTTKHTRRVQGLRDLRDLSMLILNQGCRPEELRALKQVFVDLERGTLTISKGKSAAARRTLPVTEVSRFILTARVSESGIWVFPSRRVKGHIGQHQRLWGTIVKQAKLPDLVMYDLRHTFATRAVERGVELPKLMAILGHANLRSIMRYVHMKQPHINDGMKTFERGANPSGQVVREPFQATAGPPDTGKKGENAGTGGKSGGDLSGNKIN